MTRLEREIHIDAPPEQVYDVLMDPDCLAEWVTIQDDLESAPRGDLEKGSELVQRVRVAGQRFRLRWRVEQAKRGRLAIWDGQGPLGTKAKATYELEPNGSGCTFSYTNEYELPGGPAGRLVGRAINKASGREADKSLERLKKFVERK